MTLKEYVDIRDPFHGAILSGILNDHLDEIVELIIPLYKEKYHPWYNGKEYEKFLNDVVTTKTVTATKKQPPRYFHMLDRLLYDATKRFVNCQYGKITKTKAEAFQQKYLHDDDPVGESGDHENNHHGIDIKLDDIKFDCKEIGREFAKEFMSYVSTEGHTQKDRENAIKCIEEMVRELDHLGLPINISIHRMGKNHPVRAILPRRRHASKHKRGRNH